MSEQDYIKRVEDYVKGREEEYDYMHALSEAMSAFAEGSTAYARRMAWFDEEHRRVHLHSPLAILPPYPSGWVKPTPFPRIPGPKKAGDGWKEFTEALGREPTPQDKQDDAAAWAVGG